VIGVTGTNGKTTVTTLVEQAMLRLGRRVGRIGTTGVFVDGVQRPSALTTPEAPALQALLAELEGADAVVMEVSSIGLVQHRVDGIEFHVAAFTNLSHDHLDFHGTMDAYAAAKALLFQKLRPEGGAPRALLCVDDPAWVRMEPPDDRWTYGFAAGADVRVRSMSLEPDGRVRLAMSTPAGEVDLRTALIGRHNGQNLAASLGIGLLLGFELDAWAGALGEAPPVRGRLEPVENDRGIHVYVDYAHTPAGLSAALGAVREVARGDVFVVFGCGGDRDAAKRPVMGRLAEELADYAVVTSDNPRSEPPERILAEVVAGFDEAPALAEVDRARAIAWAITHARPGDVVLIAGKGHETYQEIRGTRTPFDDREVARAVLG
jgi:UDP-N-acetylmuramoyl-L-alanyl-D-glutamate--2,6-diaminopimelate ligase